MLSRKSVSECLKKDINNFYNYDPSELKNLYNLEFIDDIENLKYILSINNQHIHKYCRNAKSTFSIDRYVKYLEWRINNPTDSNSVEYYRLVFGDNWEEIKKIRIKNKNNPYSVEYIMDRDSCSKEEAIEKINKFKTDKVTSLEGFIKRHGIEKGKEIFEKFQKTSNLFCIDNLKRIHGDNAEHMLEKYKKDTRKKSAWCVEYWESKGFSKEESIEKVREFQKENSGVSEVAIRKRFKNDPDFADYIIDRIRMKKDSSSYHYCLKVCNGDFIKANELYSKRNSDKDNSSIGNFNTYDEYIEFNNRKNEKRFKTMGMDYYINNINKSKNEISFNEYCIEVIKLTRVNMRLNGKSKFGENHKEILGVNTYHIDHNLSKYDGYIQNIDPKIISNIENLEILSANDNRRKNIKSGITIDELLDKIENSIYEKIK